MIFSHIPNPDACQFEHPACFGELKQTKYAALAFATAMLRSKGSIGALLGSGIADSRAVNSRADRAAGISIAMLLLNLIILHRINCIFTSPS